MKRSVTVCACGLLVLAAEVLSNVRADDAGRSDQPKTSAKPSDAASRDAKKRPIVVSDADLAIELRFRKALETQIRANFLDAGLDDVISFLSKAADVPMWIDKDALNEEGKSVRDMKFTLRDKQTTAASALERLLEPRGLTWIVEGEMIVVTTPRASEKRLITRVYNVGALLNIAKPGKSAMQSLVEPQLPTNLGVVKIDVPRFDPSPFDQDSSISSLIEPVMTNTEGPWEEIDGTGGTIVENNDVLVIRQTMRMHADVSAMFEQLDRLRRSTTDGGALEVRRPGYPFAADAEVRRKLKETVECEFIDTPLDEGLEFFSDLVNVQIDLDRAALSEEGVALNEPLNLNGKNVSLKAALELLLSRLGLRAIVDEGRLLVTTEFVAEELLYAVVYDVRDLARAGYDADYPLISSIQNSTSGPWEEIDGTGGTISVPFEGVLIVRQIQKVQDEIGALLTKLRNTARSREKSHSDLKKSRGPDEVLTLFYPIAGGLPDTEVQTRTEAAKAAVESFVAPDSWTAGGGQGVIHAVGPTLAVRQSVKVHLEVRRFLQKLQSAGVDAVQQ